MQYYPDAGHIDIRAFICAIKLCFNPSLSAVKIKVYGTAGQEISETNLFLVRVQSEEHGDACVVFFFVFLWVGFHWLLVLKTL